MVPLLRNSPLIVSEVGKLVPVRIAVALLSADMGNLGGHCWTAGEHEKTGGQGGLLGQALPFSGAEQVVSQAHDATSCFEYGSIIERFPGKCQRRCLAVSPGFQAGRESGKIQACPPTGDGVYLDEEPPTIQTRQETGRQRHPASVKRKSEAPDAVPTQEERRYPP